MVIEGVNIVSRDDFTINGGFNASDLTIIVYNGKFSTNGKGTMTNVNVYSQKGLTLNGSKDAVYDGTTTFATTAPLRQAIRSAKGTSTCRSISRTAISGKCSRCSASRAA